MNEQISQEAYALKQLLENDPRHLFLVEAEKKMNDSPEVMRLAYAKDTAISAYSAILEIYDRDSPEANQSRLALQSAKMALENHPLVKEYLSAYAAVRDLYLEINELLFSPFDVHAMKKEGK